MQLASLLNPLSFSAAWPSPSSASRGCADLGQVLVIHFEKEKKKKNLRVEAPYRV